MTSNLLSKITITTIYDYELVMLIINEIIKNNSMLKSFSFPASDDVIQDQKIKSKLMNLKDCSIFLISDTDGVQGFYNF